MVCSRVTFTLHTHTHTHTRIFSNSAAQYSSPECVPPSRLRHSATCSIQGNYRYGTVTPGSIKPHLWQTADQKTAVVKAAVVTRLSGRTGRRATEGTERKRAAVMNSGLLYLGMKSIEGATTPGLSVCSAQNAAALIFLPLFNRLRLVPADNPATYRCNGYVTD